MFTDDFDYELPPELIAQQPLPERDRARMLLLDRATGVTSHHCVRDIPALLQPGDLMVVNDTRVIPARLFGHKAGSGGRVETLLIEPLGDNRWHALCKASGRARPGDRYVLASGRLASRIERVAGDGSVVLALTVPGTKTPAPEPQAGRTRDASPLPIPEARILEILDAEGVTPLPPYIRRPAPDPRGAAAAPADATDVEMDRQRYQTVYARAPGAVAAPTAGLHFTPALLASLERKGVRRAAVTLHVGPGTFKPVTSDRIDQHVMECERYQVSQETADLIENTRRAGGRILAVGSTTVRTLEHVAAANQGRVIAGSGRVSLFIRPGFQFRVTDRMLTNFYLPRSTLLMMVAALAGRERILSAYREAVTARYRFYSYGDCMLIR